MKLTNRKNLPQPVVDAIANDPYDRGDSKYSATSLIKPPYMCKLESMHADELEQDVIDRVWALFGQAVHYILERANGGGYITEKRLFATVSDVKISGQVDVFFPELQLIQDYKVTSAWSVIHSQGGKPEWIQQLNILRYLCEVNNFPVKKLQIVAILRDWMRSKRFERGYPREHVQVVDLPLWPMDKIESFLKVRVNLHEKAEQLDISQVPVCSPEDMWAKKDSWAVKDAKKKKAWRVKYDEAEANDLAAQKGMVVEFRPGKRTRCEDGYCLVSKWCPDYQEYLKRAASQPES